MFDLIAIAIVGSVAYTGYKIYKSISESEIIKETKIYAEAISETFKEIINGKEKDGKEK